MTNNDMNQAPAARNDFEASCDADIHTYLRLLRTGDVIGRLTDVRTEEIWGSNRTTFAIVDLLFRFRSGMPQKEIAWAIFRSKQATAFAIDELEQKGFIERAVNSEARRVHRIVLTPKGIDHFNETVPALREVCHEALSFLSESEREQLHQILTKLTPNLYKCIDDAASQTRLPTR